MRYVVVALCLVIMCFPLLAGDKTDGDTRMHLAFFYKTGKEQIKTIALNDESVTLSTGDRLKFYYQPLSSMYLYVYHSDVHQNISSVYPGGFNAFADAKEEVYIPKGSPDEGKKQWFSLIDKGPDVFYIIASTKRLKNLEVLTRKYRNSRDNEGIHLFNHLEQLVMIAEDAGETGDIFQKSFDDYHTISGTVKGLEFSVHTIKVATIYARKITITH